MWSSTTMETQRWVGEVAATRTPEAKWEHVVPEEYKQIGYTEAENSLRLFRREYAPTKKNTNTQAVFGEYARISGPCGSPAKSWRAVK